MLPGRAVLPGWPRMGWTIRSVARTCLSSNTPQRPHPMPGTRPTVQGIRVCVLHQRSIPLLAPSRSLFREICARQVASRAYTRLPDHCKRHECHHIEWSHQPWAMPCHAMLESVKSNERGPDANLTWRAGPCPCPWVAEMVLEREPKGKLD